MRDDFIEAEETLYRAVTNFPNMWKSEFDRPSSAVFKDKAGVSIDREGGRELAQIKALFQQRFEGCGLLSLHAAKCIAIPTHLEPDPLQNNEYHALIKDSKKIEKVGNSKVSKLVEISMTIEKPERFR